MSRIFGHRYILHDLNPADLRISVTYDTHTTALYNKDQINQLIHNWCGALHSIPAAMKKTVVKTTIIRGSLVKNYLYF